MYINENGEYVTVHTYTDDDGDKIVQKKTYQNNGRVRINEEYPDGTKCEYFCTEEDDSERRYS